MTRSELREQAFILLFEYSFCKESAEELFDIARETDTFVEDEYLKEVVSTAIANIFQIDELIGKYSNGWSAERIARVTLAALRVAVAEIKYIDTIPESVSINEAVEIIKKYATEQDAAFANGILGSIVRADKD